MSPCLASIAPLVGTVTVNKGDMKTIYKCMLVDDSRIDETVGSRIREFGIQCGSSREGRQKGRIKIKGN